MTENGPCYVNQDGNSTTQNPFSRNNRVNMLCVDQLVGAGYSFSTLVNVTLNQLTGDFTPTDFSEELPFVPNITIFPGTVSNPNLAFTTNNSNIAAKAMWHFAQVWFETFPIYHPQDDSISLWTNSVSHPSEFPLYLQTPHSRTNVDVFSFSTADSAVQPASNTGSPKIRKSNLEN